MSGFVRACALADLADGKPHHVDLGDTPVVVVKDRNGVYALVDECSHASIELSEGDVNKGTIECWLHGSRFDLRTGKPLSLPATEPVKVFATRIDGDDVYVSLEES
ncbi:MAG: 3-phenylpropionate/trans-cinnamate dioxygenase ferredoxin component [Frankiaceae bacterium]|jgi:3-phenylpropionate/trans-cinnamate dioxygenase ferredoxin subunit|nr:3-phenylpropionate/trans-cinnamate dioxygenase ferredoxin component [Frankiaceae bacterium]